MSPYTPLPGTYAVARLDVQTTLQGLSDPTALEAAAGLKSAKCLICMGSSLQLPSPQDPWRIYEIYLVGQGLQPANPEAGIISDKSVPIFPCIEHPSHRPPARPNSPFPFGNCYHWAGSHMKMRVRVKTREWAGYNEGRVLKLSEVDRVELEQFLGGDLARSLETMSGDQEKETSEVSGPRCEAQTGGETTSTSDTHCAETSANAPVTRTTEAADAVPNHPARSGDESSEDSEGESDDYSDDSDDDSGSDSDDSDDDASR
ncbi:hypothetical protein C8Q76DRAFT_822421 [Earliella scabrosa]|nr:hypothetical protein C8Q76DRAFT_822421 [Earliella scabrosa]